MPIQWRHHHNRTACSIACPAHSCYAARLAAGKGRLWLPLQMSPWSRLFWGTRCQETTTIPHPMVHFCHCPVLCAFSMHRDEPRPWARHPDLWVPPDGVTTFPSLSPLHVPLPLKHFTPVMVSAGTCTYVPRKSPLCKPEPSKCFAPATVSASLRCTQVPQGSRTTQRSPPLHAHCQMPARQCLAT